MSTVFNSLSAVPARPAADAAQRQSSGILAVAGAIVLIAAVGVPLFVRMPLTNDAVLFDLQAQVLRSGGTLYQDILEPNLPGVVWVHAAVRTAFGESSAALRLFDLAVFAGIAGLGAGWLRSAGATTKSAGWFTTAAVLFYLSLSEWCHCQRDTWMLLPTLAALTIRGRQVRDWMSATLPTLPQHQLFWSLLEGLLWGAAIWIKPYAILPAAACWTVSQLLIRRRRYFFADSVGLLAGGLAAGAAGITWLVQSGAWPAFFDTLTEWNPRYFRAGREHWTLARFVAMSVRMWPWSVLHLAAIPVAIFSLSRTLLPSRSARCPPNSDTTNAMTALLAVFYLAWCVHAFFLQHLFDYVHAPALLLALLLIACRVATTPPSRSLRRWRLAAYAFALLAVLASPLARPERLKLWTRCVTEPNSPALQDQLAHFRNPNRVDLARVARFLQREGARNRDVCCYNSDLVSLYTSLHFLPPTRYVYLRELLIFFPDRREEIEASLDQSPHRFVVTDLASSDLSPRQAAEIGPAGPLAPPPAFDELSTRGFPWSLPVVYRSGTYLVHQVDRPAP